MNIEVINNKCDQDNIKKLEALANDKLVSFIAKFAQHCNPDSIFVRTDSDEDKEYIKSKAIANNEEKTLNINGHTIHFDGMNDQGRDKEVTRYLLTDKLQLSSHVNTINKQEGLDEVLGFLKNSMQGKEMIVAFFCLGPLNSEFSIPCVQITDSFYVAHSEGILYRSGYEFIRQTKTEDFFRFVHTAGELENNVSKNGDKKRIYIDLEENTVYSTNTQYAGNTVGLKKLAMRLAIQKSSREGWLTEHMFVMNVHGKNNRASYFVGAFPSACGKTSTSMLGGESIIGDDIAYIRSKNGKMIAVNVEAGIFGIIQDINPDGDPVIYDALKTPGDVIFSNVLLTENGIPRWMGDGKEAPVKGINFSGEWTPGKKDAKGNTIDYAHKNARYTISLSKLDNCDVNANNPDGVEISGIIYGGRDSDTSVPVVESFNWQHGIITKGATLESETTAATIGQQGVRVFNPMSNMDFLSITLGKYISNNLNIVDKLEKAPAIYSVNYFLKNKDGKYLNGIKDKHAWLKWMELRVNGEADAIKTPVGYIPKYQDLKNIFSELLNKDFTEEDYVTQFTLRIPENIAKIDRILDIYKKEGGDTPAVLYTVLEKQKIDLENVRAKYGDYVSPFTMEESPVEISA
ncbi:MAG: phosphoenolpyruvate carboxykinase (GTP) [Candidatus Margulisiibacteriota bacterium]